MIASGWQTAPPQVTDPEVVLVTKSACPEHKKSAPCVSGFSTSAMLAPPLRGAAALMAQELSQHLAPGIVHAAILFPHPVRSMVNCTAQV